MRNFRSMSNPQIGSGLCNNKLLSETINDYPLRTYDKLRFSDTDKQGHINNAVYSTFYETGRTQTFEEAHKVADNDDCEFVIAQITIQYLAETHWPGTVEVGTRIKRVGNSSLVLEQAIFSNGNLCSTGESICVQINTASRKSQPFDDALRSYFESLMEN
jgi:acyl-CoA thioester hydrolase